MNRNKQFFGMVRDGEFVIIAPERLKGDSVRLATIQIQEAQSPDSNEIDLSEYEGKIIELSGHDRRGWIYSAEVAEEAGAVLTNFLKKMFFEEDEHKKRCALVIGHNKDSPGAMNENSNVNEFTFNEELGLLIEKKVKNANINRIYRRTYKTLPGDINELDPDFVISLHCNSFDGKISGSEVLYHHKSQKGKEIAELLLKNLVEYLKLSNRGIKPRTTEDKGGYLLRYKTAPCVIGESFFIDNDSDLARATEDLDGVTEAYAKAIDEISQKLRAENEPPPALISNSGRKIEKKISKKCRVY